MLPRGNGVVFLLQRDKIIVQVFVGAVSDPSMNKSGVVGVPYHLAPEGRQRPSVIWVDLETGPDKKHPGGFLTKALRWSEISAGSIWPRRPPL